MNALKKMAAERGAYIAVVTLFLIGATILSTILHTDSDYAAGLTKPDENTPSTEAESAPSISEPDFSYERFAMTFTGLINAGSMLGSCQEGFCRAADTALEALQDSFAELRGSYGSALEKKAADIFSKT